MPINNADRKERLSLLKVTRFVPGIGGGVTTGIQEVRS
jgi:hypothetical protein